MSNRTPQKIVTTAHFGDTPPESIAEICRIYSPGTTVQVTYSPEDPSKSFIYFTSPWRDWPTAIFPIMAALLGWFFIFASRFVK